MPIALTLAALLSLAGAPETPERHQDLIHSDTPLWGAESTRLWPRSFQDGEDFGCLGNQKYGLWRYDEQPSGDEKEQEQEQEPVWYAFRNYGVFHCAMLVAEDHDKGRIFESKAETSFLVELGTARNNAGERIDLWALQRGTVPGSRYLLLARRPTGRLIDNFDVLQRDCPSGRTRKGPQIDIFTGSYCAINSRAELVRLALRMAKRPPLGRLTFAEPFTDADN